MPVGGHKVFVGGLQWETSEEGLKMYFEQFGDIIDVNIMRDRFTGQPRGFGFISIGNNETLKKVMGKSKHVIDGKDVEVKEAFHRSKGESENHDDSSRNDDESSKTTLHVNYQDPEKKIFVGGLLPETNEEDLEKYFGQFGSVKGVVIIYDPLSKRSRGFGFVTFIDEEGIQKACSEKIRTIQGKSVEIKRYKKNGPSISTGNSSFNNSSSTTPTASSALEKTNDLPGIATPKKRYSTQGYSAYKKYIPKTAGVVNNEEARNNNQDNNGRYKPY